MYYLQHKPSTSFLCLVEPELWSLKGGVIAKQTCFFPIFSRSYLRNYTTYLTKNPHTLFSNHVLQPCQISKQSEGVRGKHLLNPIILYLYLIYSFHHSITFQLLNITTLQLLNITTLHPDDVYHQLYIY